VYLKIKKIESCDVAQVVIIHKYLCLAKFGDIQSMKVETLKQSFIMEIVARL
jgi:hypothetical protein